MVSIEAALAEQCLLAYAQARRLVFDRFPAGGVPPREALDPEQRHALLRLEAAEAAQLWHRRQNGQKFTS